MYNLFLALGAKMDKSFGQVKLFAKFVIHRSTYFHQLWKSMRTNEIAASDFNRKDDTMVLFRGYAALRRRPGHG